MLVIINQSFLKLIVEHVNKDTKTYEFASVRSKSSLKNFEEHSLGLIAVHKLVTFNTIMNKKTTLTRLLENLEARLGVSLEDSFDNWEEKFGNFPKKIKNQKVSPCPQLLSLKPINTVLL